MVLALIPVSASASQWWVLDGGDGVCVDSVTAASRDGFSGSETPYALEQEARREGIFKDIEIRRDDSGKISVVGITITQESGNDIMILFFSTLQGCKAALSWGEQRGYIGTKGELN